MKFVSIAEFLPQCCDCVTYVLYCLDLPSMGYLLKLVFVQVKLQARNTANKRGEDYNESLNCQR